MTANTARKQTLMREYNRLAQCIIDAASVRHEVQVSYLCMKRNDCKRELVALHGLNEADFAGDEQALRARLLAEVGRMEDGR